VFKLPISECTLIISSDVSCLDVYNPWFRPSDYLTCTFRPSDAVCKKHSDFVTLSPEVDDLFVPSPQISVLGSKN
jgi:hypothetical protein